MKLKRNLFMIAIIIVIACYLFSCTNGRPSITLGNNLNNLYLLSRACDDENYVYYVNNAGLMKISKGSGQITDMGISTDNFLHGLNIIDGYLYLDTMETHGSTVSVEPCKINLSTGEISEMASMGGAGGAAVIINEMIYFQGISSSSFIYHRINKDGTGGAAFDDNRYRVLGVENNAIYAYVPEEENITENGVTKSVSWIYRLSSNWKPEEKLFRLSFRSEGWNTFYVTFGGYVYVSEFNGYEAGADNYNFHIYRHRLAANSEKEILFDSGYNWVYILAVTEDGVYFYYTNQIYAERDPARSRSNIHRINHNGTGLRELPHNPASTDILFVSNIDGKFYGITGDRIVLIE